MADASMAECVAGEALPQCSYQVPTDVLLALPTSSAVRGLIQERRDAGMWPKPMATVFARGRRYFAIVDFDGRPGNRGLLYPLDVYAWDPPA